MYYTRDYQTRTCRCSFGFYVDIVENNAGFSAYIWHKDYATKELMFGVPKLQNNGVKWSLDEFFNIVEINFKEYAEDYYNNIMCGSVSKEEKTLLEQYFNSEVANLND